MKTKLNDKLSEHFTFKELINTSHIEFMKEQEKDAQQYIYALKALCKRVLEPIRVFYGKAMIITSGYRGLKLNYAVGGSKISQHCRGEAADFVIPSIENMTIMKDIKDKKINVKFGQCIHEIIGGKDWIHISLGYPYRMFEANGQMLDTKDGKTYTEY